MYNIIVQTIGFIGVALCVLCYHGKSRKALLGIKFSADVAWATHYFMLGAKGGFVINVLCGIREIVYLFEKNKKRRVFWLCFFILINWAVAIFSWAGVSSLFPAIVSTIAAYSFWQENIRVTRILALVISSLMLTYDIFVLSYAGIVNESLTIISVVTAIYRDKRIGEKI